MIELSSNIPFWGVLATQILSLVIFLRFLLSYAFITRTKYKIIRLSLKFNARNYKGNAIQTYMNIDDGTIFQYYIQRYIGKKL